MPPATRAQRRRLVLVIVVAELAVAAVTAVTVATAYRALDRNLDTLPEIPHVVGRPAAAEEEATTPLNVLVMGTDTRAGRGNDIDGEATDSERSDTTILLHASADRETVYGVSIARDTMVERPDCRVGGRVVPGEDPAIWNDAFSLGGALCTVQQFEHVTGIYVDHTVVVDFNGFKDMVDAVHGVEVCIPRDVTDPEHGIFLEAGRRLVSGDEALDYVRERTQLSANADLGRMRRQQAFIASMASRVLSADTLTSPTRLYDFLDAATGSLTLDPDLGDLADLVELGREFRSTSPGDIEFVTAPVEAYPPDPNRLQLAPQARELWRLVRKDEPLGRFAGRAISAGEEVGEVGNTDTSGQAQDRRANGLCS